MIRRSSRLSGFTLVELLVVIAIIGILVALLLPAVQAAREAARRMQCGNNLKQMALGCMNYESTYKCFPAMQTGTGHINAGFQRFCHSGFYCIFPFCEQQTLYDQVTQHDRENWNGNAMYATRVGYMECPSDAGLIDPSSSGRTRTLNSYAFCSGDNYAMSQLYAPTEERSDPALAAQKRPIRNRGIFGRASFTKIAEVTDGTSNTIMLGERSRPATTNDKGSAILIAGANITSYIPLSCKVQFNGRQYLNPALVFLADTQPGYRGMAGNCFFSAMTTILPPNSAVCNIGQGSVSPHWFPGVWTATSEHPGGVQIALADGSVRFISDTIDTGNLGAVAPAADSGVRSPFGVWGAMGTKSAGESVQVD